MLKKSSKSNQDSPSNRKDSRKTIANVPSSPSSSRDLSFSTSSPTRGSVALSAATATTPKSEEGLIYDQGTTLISSASLNKALHVLASQVAAGGFLNEFLLTYKLFTSPTDLLSKILDKLKSADSQADATIVRLRVVNIVKTWIKECPQDWLPTEPLHQDLLKFIDSQKDPELEKLLSSIKIVLSKTATITSANSTGASPMLSVASSAASSKSAPLTQLRIANQLKNLKELNPAELVEQLTLIDQEIFDTVSATDMIVWVVQPNQREGRAAKLTRFLERFSELRSWVATAVVEESEQKSRVDLIAKFIAMADAAIDIGSFSLCAALVAGLGHPALAQLTSTWTALPKDKVATLEQLKSVCSPKENYAAMTSAMDLWRAPCIPFLGGLLQKLQDMNTKSSTSLFVTQTGAAGTENDMLSFAKLRPMTDATNVLRAWRSTGLALKPKLQIQTLFRKLNVLDDQALASKAATWNESSSPVQEAGKPFWLLPVVSTERKGVSQANLLAASGVEPTKPRAPSASASKRVVVTTEIKLPTSNASPSTTSDSKPTSPLTAKPPTASIKPPSDDESLPKLPKSNSRPSIVPVPGVASASGSIVSPRPARTTSSTVLLHLQKLEPKQATQSTATVTVPQSPPSPPDSSSTPPPEVETLPPPRERASLASSSSQTTLPVQSSLADSMSGSAPPSPVPTPRVSSAVPIEPEELSAIIAENPFDDVEEVEKSFSPRAETRHHHSLERSQTSIGFQPAPHEADASAHHRSHSAATSPATTHFVSPFTLVPEDSSSVSPQPPPQSPHKTPSKLADNVGSMPAVAASVPSAVAPAPTVSSTAPAAATPAPATSSTSSFSRAASTTIQRTVLPLPDGASKEDIRRSQIVAEIFDTEKSYVDFINLLVKDGIEPLRKGGIIPEADIKAVFSNIETIADFHRIFLTELTAVINSWNPNTSIVGNLFIKFYQYFKLYVEFVNNFDKSNAALVKLLSKNTKFKDVQTHLIQRSGKLDYNALLIMPVQRVPRYVLLLKDLRGRTPEDHPDYDNLHAAIKRMKEVSVHINASKKDAELHARALDLKKRLQGYTGELFKPGRRFIRESDAYIVSNKGGTRVTLLFWNDILMICRPQDKKLTYMGQFSTGKLQLRTLMTKDVKKKLKASGKEGKELNTDKYRWFVAATFFDCEIILATRSDSELQQLLDDHKTAQLEMGARWFKKVSGGEGLPAPDPRDLVGHALVSKVNPATGAASSVWYIYGGAHKTIFYDDLWALDFEKYQWERVDANSKGDKPGPRADHTLVAVGRKLYLWGGHNAGAFVRDMYCFTIDTNTWTKVEALPLNTPGAAPVGRAGHTASVVENRYILIFGGSTFENVSSSSVYNDMYIFDTETNTWAAAPGDTSTIPPRFQHSCVLLNGERMFIYGGKSRDNKDLNDMHYFDKNTGVWTTVTDMTGQVPAARSASAVAADDETGRVLLYGGGSVLDTYGDLFIFRTRDHAWTLCSLPMDLPKRKSHAMVLVADPSSPTSNLAIFGGRVQQSDGTMEYRNEVFVIKDIRKYMSGASSDMLKQAQKLKAKVGKLVSYSVTRAGTDAKFEEISGSFNFVHKVHVDSDFRWDVGQNPADIFEMETQLGKGGFGEVWRAKHKESEYELAIKRVFATSGLEKMSKEMEILRKCRHPSIVKYFGFTQVAEESWIMMELCEFGSIRDLMKLTQKPLTEKQAAAVIASTIQGLAYLHGLDILHRDVKSGNILLGTRSTATPTPFAKLSDFGLSEFANQASSTLSGSLPFMAPEVIKDRQYSEKSDIWALGITLIEMLENTPPFDKLLKPKKFSSDAQDFIAQCLHNNPIRRPTAIQLLQHPFITANMATNAEAYKELADSARKARAKALIPSASSGSLVQSPSGSNISSAALSAFSGASTSSVGSSNSSTTPSLSFPASSASEQLQNENSRLLALIEHQQQEISELKQHNSVLEARLAAIERHLGLVAVTKEPFVEQLEQLHDHVEIMPIHYSGSKETHHSEIDALTAAPAEEMMETLHPTELLHSSDSLLHVDNHSPSYA